MTAEAKIHVKQYLFEETEPTIRRIIFYASNGKFSGEFELYCHTHELAEMGKALNGMLATFPAKYPDEYSFVYRSEDSKDKYNRYFKIKVYTKSINACAINISMNLDIDDPFQGKSVFTLDFIDPAAIRKLGDLFISLSNSEEKDLVWSPDGNPD